MKCFYLIPCLTPFYFSPRSQIHYTGVPRYHHLDHWGSSSGSDTFWTEVLWHWLNRGQHEEHDLQIALSIFCLVNLNVSHVLLVVPNTATLSPEVLNWNKMINLSGCIYYHVFLRCVLMLKKENWTLNHIKSSTWIVLFCMLQQLMENKEFIFVNRQKSKWNGISTFGVSEVLKKGHSHILRQFKRDHTGCALAILNSCLQTGYNLSSSHVINILLSDKRKLLCIFKVSLNGAKYTDTASSSNESVNSIHR